MAYRFGSLPVAALLLGICLPRAASAAQGAELYRTESYFYGRFEARIRFAPGEGVVSSFFLWKNGSSSTTSWNELDYEKANANCRLQTNIWTGTGTQSSEIDTPAFDICAAYHTYAYEWTPDYIAWLIDGTQVRKVTGASVAEYTRNASQGMTFHFNVWVGNSDFGGTLNPSTLPVHEYISWVQYSSYANGAFQMQWREEFNGSTMPSGWMAGTWASAYNLSTHNPANVTFSDGIAVLSLTADNATGNSGTPPADPSGGGGSGGIGGTAGAGGAGARGGVSGGAGTSATAGASGSIGTAGAGGVSATAGRGGNGGANAAGTGGATAAGTGGVSGTGGTSPTGSGTGSGGTTGAGGSAGTGSSGTFGTAGSAATAGATGQNPSGTGGTGKGGGSGAAGSAGQGGSDSGCACQVGATNRAGAAGALLLFAAGLLVGRRRRGRPRR